jgi:hypothetical protein
VRTSLTATAKLMPVHAPEPVAPLPTLITPTPVRAG